jgi:DNA-binding IclR family transcriptional regulator
MPDDIPAKVHNLISEHIRSIAQLELLLMLRREPERKWSVEEVAKALYTAVSMTEPLLETLRSSGFVAATGETPERYQYAPRSAEMGQAVADLDGLYQERRVTIINLIYSAPTEKLRNFADAFRIRRKEEED